MNETFEEQGWCVIPQALDSEARTSALEWITAAAARAESDPGLQAQFEEGSPGSRQAVKKMRRLLWNDQPFWTDLLRRCGLFAIGKTFVPGTPAVIFHASFLKPAFVGSRIGLHQDQGLWEQQYPNAVSVWIALMDATPENGCLVIYPGSHLHGLLPHTPDPTHPSHPTIAEETLTKLGLNSATEVPMAAGDVIVWHRYMVHASGPNRTNQDRIGTVLVFADAGQKDFRSKDLYII
jgi:ectoine hydroxylase-related dioxygenase (phytanoyl-CoA dioxygenase family)